MILDETRYIYASARRNLLLRGLIALALGIFILVRPLESAAAFALVIAIWALVVGVIQIVNAFELRSALPHWWLLLASGVVSTLFGLAALYYYPALSLAFAVIWAAYWLLLSGFFGIYAAMLERRMNLPWVWTLIFGIVGALAGLYAIAVPPATLAAILTLMAAFAIVSGIVLLVAFFNLGALRRRAQSSAGAIRP